MFCEEKTIISVNSGQFLERNCNFHAKKLNSKALSLRIGKTFGFSKYFKLFRNIQKSQECSNKTTKDTALTHTMKCAKTLKVQTQ